MPAVFRWLAEPSATSCRVQRAAELVAEQEILIIVGVTREVALEPLGLPVDAQRLNRFRVERQPDGSVPTWAGQRSHRRRGRRAPAGQSAGGQRPDRAPARSSRAAPRGRDPRPDAAVEPPGCLARGVPRRRALPRGVGAPSVSIRWPVDFAAGDVEIDWGPGGYRDRPEPRTCSPRSSSPRTPKAKRVGRSRTGRSTRS